MNRACFVSSCLALALSQLELATAASGSRPMHAELSLPAGMQWILPVRSPQLSPGVVKARPLNMPGLKPFFLVGEDQASRDWLQTNAEHLQSISAAGLVVDVTDAKALAELQGLVPTLTVVPVSGDDIAARLELEHYPVLISSTGLSQ